MDSNVSAVSTAGEEAVPEKKQPDPAAENAAKEAAPAAKDTDKPEAAAVKSAQEGVTYAASSATAASAADSGGSSAPLLGDAIGQQLLQNVFPDSGLKAEADAGFTITVDKTDFEEGVWHSKWDEKDVFRVQLENKKDSSNPYTIRLGKGGQMYSIKTKIGEIMPPQSVEHAFVDDMLLVTYLDYGRNFMNVEGAPQVDQLTGFIHQAGMYQHKDEEAMKANDPSGCFYSPIVAEWWNEERSEYSCITLGMTSTGPSYNRGDVLIYTSVRDMGGGVIECNYLTYNYNSYYNPNDPQQIVKASDLYLTDVSTWGGVRKSVLPKAVVGKADDPTTYENPFGGDNGMPRFGEGNNMFSNVKETGGWFAAVNKLNDPKAFAYSWIYGNKGPGKKLTSFFSFGDASGKGPDGFERDFNVINLTYRAKLEPGSVCYYRMYYAFGDLDEVATKSAYYKDYTDSAVLEFTQAQAETAPLYLEEKDGQQVLTTEKKGDPALYVYTQPVQNSKPLFLIRNKKSGLYHVTSDPYMLMERVPIEGDYQYPKRTGIRPYDGSTEIVKLYGFVMPQTEIDESLSYVRLDSVLTDDTYYPQIGIYDTDIMVRTNQN